MSLDSDRSWQAVEAADPRFDGWIFCGVTSTGIYCRPSCPARTPKRENVRFFSTAAGAQGAGFRACKRCRPDATPGSPEWDRRADLVGRAMRLIADGVVDRGGVTGLASALGYSERHVHRELVSVVGAGPLALARAQRGQAARVLLETTRLPIIEVASAAGFASVRQFNATVHEIFATNPRELRARSRRNGEPRRGARPIGDRAALLGGAARPGGAIELRLPYRAPMDAEGLIAFLARRAVPGVEEALAGGGFARSLALPHGAGTIELRPGGDPRRGARPIDDRPALLPGGHVAARFALDDVRDLGAAVQRSRALLDLDSDPHAVVDALGDDPLLGALVRGSPGRRVAGHVDAHELAVRAVLGQQVSLAGAATLAARLVAAYGEPLEHPLGGVTHVFPRAEALAAVDPGELAMPRGRREALVGLAHALAREELVLDAGADRAEARAQLLALPGIGPWTADYVAMRALRDPDAFLASDLGVRHAIEALGGDGRPAAVEALAERWRPYRAYAVAHLWGANFGAQ